MRPEPTFGRTDLESQARLDRLLAHLATRDHLSICPAYGCCADITRRDRDGCCWDVPGIVGVKADGGVHLHD